MIFKIFINKNNNSYKLANKCVDDGRGDSPRLRPIDSLPRPSHETL